MNKRTPMHEKVEGEIRITLNFLFLVILSVTKTVL